jgi:predicted nuclease of restriction endonuclease-like (RecB) superfamily
VKKPEKRQHPGELPQGYGELLEIIKSKVCNAQIQAALSVNRELLSLYWEIGREILEKQNVEGWGAKTTEKLSRDLKSAFPSVKGFSRTNLSYMAQFAREYPDPQIVQQLVGQIPWGHNIALLQKLDSLEERVWYAQKTIENGWSRSVLINWIDSGLFRRQGKAVSNFAYTLPAPQSDLAHETLKDPYSFDFLTLREDFDERELEDGLIDHIQRFLLEMGSGFSYVGRQVHLEVGGQDYYMDVLFYHLKLRCFVVVELKVTEFKPEYAGKMNFYLSAVDDLMKHKDDNPTIGILLCKTKNKLVAEYALRDIHKPMGVSEYEVQLLESLPEEFKGSLPSIEEIESELR